MPRISLAEPEEFRCQLADAIGADRYRTLLSSLNAGGLRRKGRFLYAQEKMLAELGITAATSQELFHFVEPLLRICELHHWPLQGDPTRDARFARGAISAQSIEQRRICPNIDCGPLPPYDGSILAGRGLWYCHKCQLTNGRGLGYGMGFTSK